MTSTRLAKEEPSRAFNDHLKQLSKPKMSNFIFPVQTVHCPVHWTLLVLPLRGALGRLRTDTKSAFWMCFPPRVTTPSNLLWKASFHSEKTRLLMMIIGVVIAVHDDIMEVLVLPVAHGLEAEIVDDEQIRLGQSRQFALVRAHWRRGELTQELGVSGEHGVVAATYGDVTQGLGKVALPVPQGSTMSTGTFFSR